MITAEHEKELLELIPLDEIQHPENLRIACENAYRRGFHQGFYAATEAAGNGWSYKKLQDYCLNTIYRWRLQKHQGQPEEPRWPTNSSGL
jgi:hypothetical protein